MYNRVDIYKFQVVQFFLHQAYSVLGNLVDFVPPHFFYREHIDFILICPCPDNGELKK